VKQVLGIWLGSESQHAEQLRSKCGLYTSISQTATLNSARLSRPRATKFITAGCGLDWPPWPGRQACRDNRATHFHQHLMLDSSSCGFFKLAFHRARPQRKRPAQQAPHGWHYRSHTRALWASIDYKISSCASTASSHWCCFLACSLDRNKKQRFSLAS